MVSVLLWVSIAGWLLLLLAGAVAATIPGALDDGDFVGAADSADASDGMFGLGWFVLFGLGVAMWALLALWASWTARAARGAGRGGEVPYAHMGWWGVFVPLASAVLPVLAYVQAARFADSARHGRAGRVPALLVAWWVTFVAAAVFVLTGSGYQDEQVEVGDLETYGALLVVGGLLGTVSAVLGALATRAVAATARDAATGG